MLAIPMILPASQGLPSTSGSTTATQARMPSRPKLSLQTTSLPMTFGNSTTGLSLVFSAGAGPSPTVRNTFRNAYDIPVPSSATASPSKSSARISRLSSQYAVSGSGGKPYQLPVGVRSILRNSPLQVTSRRQSLSLTPNGGIENRAASSRRVFFPAEKHVSYRKPLEEEIRTVRYTARHSDLDSGSESDDQNESGSGEDVYTGSSPSNTSGEDFCSDHEQTSNSDSNGTRKRRKFFVNPKQVRAAALLDGLEPDDVDGTTPQTPVDRRMKRRRRWRWTLAPLQATNEAISVPDVPPSKGITLPGAPIGRTLHAVQALVVPTTTDIQGEETVETVTAGISG